MSKILLHVSQDDFNFDYHNLLDRLNPLNTKNRLIESKNYRIGITAYNKSVIINDNYLALGVFKTLPEDTGTFNTQIPDGVAALIRFDKMGNIQMLTNALASRTLWYFQDNKDFIVSTSQRAIINIIGNYVPNEVTISWMLSSGNLGPGNSWDKRIKHLNYNELLTFDISKWHFKIKTRAPLKIENNKKKADPKKLLSILKKSFSETILTGQKIGLTLSGGYDSRFVMKMLKNNAHDFETITWGTSSSLYEKDTDSYIASEFSRENQIPFNFFNVELNKLNFDEFLEKFVVAGEARIDHLSNYMDNFKMWEKLVELNFQQIIRSDEVFGWVPVSDENNVRLLMEMCKISNYDNFRDLSYYGIKEFDIPKEFLKSNDESLYSWRDRLFNIYRQTYVQPAIHDLIYAYIEMINPLFSDDIINFARGLNDKDRTNKSLYIKAIKKHIGNAKIANRPSYPKRENVLKSETAFKSINRILEDPKTETLISKKFIIYIKNNLKLSPDIVKVNNSKLTVLISKITPIFVKNFVRKRFRIFNLDYNLVGFRIALIYTWNNLIENDLKDNFSIRQKLKKDSNST